VFCAVAEPVTVLAAPASPPPNAPLAKPPIALPSLTVPKAVSNGKIGSRALKIEEAASIIA